MRYKYITKYSWILLFLCVFEQISAQNLNGALINSCGTEGANEFLFFKNGGTGLVVSPANIDIRYGTNTTPGTSGNLTNSLGAPVSGSFVSDLNALLPSSGCAITFAYAALGSTIPANANFLLMNDDANNVINYTGWCNSGLSTTIYIIFSTSSNWASSGQIQEDGILLQVVMEHMPIGMAQVLPQFIANTAAAHRQILPLCLLN
jgi:hypothetical protein